MFNIYHISDLHIRSGDSIRARCDEYAFVFGKFLNVLEEDPHAQQSMVVITGDVFHNKNRLDSPGIKLFYDFIKGLTDRVKHVFIIRGNHDYKQWEVTEVDLITSLLIPGIDGVTYIDETCVIDLKEDFGPAFDACIGVLAIQDVLRSGNTSAKEKTLTPIAFPTPLKRKHRIALFHGVVSGSAEEFFKGYTVAMMGDIHDQRVVADGPVVEGGGDGELLYKKRIDGKFAWGYAGSMIRQGLGEEEIGHGYLLWTLGATQTYVSAYHIFNPVEIALPNLMGGKATDATATATAATKKNKDGEATEPDDIDISYEDTAIKLESGPSQWIEFVGEDNPGVKFIREIHTLVPPLLSSEFGAKAKERVDKVVAKMQLYQQDHPTHQNNPFRLVNLKWDWILCYGPDNVFDFDCMDKKITVLGGKNGHGKTSFLETILISLYGTGFPSRTNKHFSSSIINYQKPKGAVCQTQMILKMAPSEPGDKPIMARITRQFYKQAESTDKLHSNSKNTLVCIFGPNGWTNERSGKVAVDEWVNKHVGSYESFLLSCMVSQNADCDFFSMNACDQKEMLDRAMKIDAHSRFMDLLRESRLAHQWLSEMVGARIGPILSFTSSFLGQRESMILRKAELEGGHRDVDAALLALRPRSHYEKQLTLPATTDLETTELAALKKLVKGNGSRSPMPPEYVGKDIPWFDRELAQLGPAARPVDDDVGYDVGPYEEGCRACDQRRLARLARLSEDRRHGLLLGLERARVARITLLEEKVEKNELRKQAIEAIALLDREKGAIETGVELQRIKDKLAEGDLQVEELGKWKTIKKDIDDVIGCISHLSSKLEGFVSHLYTNTIIPNVTRLSNEIIHLVDSTLVLDGSVSGDGKRIDWTISREDGARPPIEKASGFQRFIAGLAVRIALGWAGLGVGAAGKQLFLDEGFTSCDSTNLSKVPNFLLSLLNIYDGILLVTHLEELKESESTHYLSIHCDQETGASVLLQQTL